MTPGAPLAITLFPFSNIGHLRQVFTGFHLLERLGLISLRYSKSGPALFNHNPPNDLDRGAYCLVARIEGFGDVAYDVHDSDVIVDPLHQGCRLYFKRSYNRLAHSQDPKIKPLGLNLLIENQDASLIAAWRALSFGRGRTRYGDVLRALAISPPYTARPSDLTTFPVAQKDPKVLFLARAWEPGGYYGVTDEEIEQRRAINALRAGCIRHLRREFGDRFVGGLSPDSFAREHFGDVLADPTAVRKDVYLRSLSRFDVCISTQGLLGSTGWKFAEYLALGRSVVTETMPFEAVGPLKDGVNYLTFETPEQCVEAVTAIFEDRTRRQEMMSLNASYYQSYVRPEALVFNSLTTALSDASA